MARALGIFCLATLPLCLHAGCSAPDLIGTPIESAVVAERIGLDRATHARIGPTFVPHALRGQAITVDEVALTRDQVAEIEEALTGLRRVVEERASPHSPTPIGPWFRYFRNGDPVGPWMTLEPYRTRNGRSTIILRTFSTDPDSGRVTITAYLELKQRPSLAGEFDETASVAAPPSHHFPLYSSPGFPPPQKNP